MPVKNAHPKPQEAKRPPSQAETDLLTCLPRYTFATIDQLMRTLGLEVADASKLRMTQMRLKWLTEQGYLVRIERESTRSTGSLKPAYRLGKKGQDYLVSLGITAPLFDRPAPLTLEHTLVVNDVLLSAQAVAHRHDNVTLTRCLHDYDLRKLTLPVSPDGFIYFTVTLPEGVKYTAPLFFELDQGTEGLKVIADKVKGYLDLLTTSYQQVFGLAEGPAIAFLTTGGEPRVGHLCQTLEATLRQAPLSTAPQFVGQFFYVTRLGSQEDADDPTALFLSRRFLLPFHGPGRYALLNIKRLPAPWPPIAAPMGPAG